MGPNECQCPAIRKSPKSTCSSPSPAHIQIGLCAVFFSLLSLSYVCEWETHVGCGEHIKKRNRRRHVNTSLFCAKYWGRKMNGTIGVWCLVVHGWIKRRRLIFGSVIGILRLKSFWGLSKRFSSHSLFSFLLYQAFLSPKLIIRSFNSQYSSIFSYLGASLSPKTIFLAILTFLCLFLAF